jgi:hypothetical protein
MAEARKMILRKIPILDLLKIMQHLYTSGADFVDIVGVGNVPGQQDEIMVAVKEEYMSKEEREFDEEYPLSDEDMERMDEEVSQWQENLDEELAKMGVTLTDEDINNLLD